MLDVCSEPGLVMALAVQDHDEATRLIVWPITTCFPIPTTCCTPPLLRARLSQDSAGGEGAGAGGASGDFGAKDTIDMLMIHTRSSQVTCHDLICPLPPSRHSRGYLQRITQTCTNIAGPAVKEHRFFVSEAYFLLCTPSLKSDFYVVFSVAPADDRNFLRPVS